MEKVLNAWLNHLCSIISGVRCAVLLTGPPDQGPYDTILSWPDDEAANHALFAVARVALRNSKPVIKIRSSEAEETGEPLDALACPLFQDGRLIGAVAVELSGRSRALQQAAMQQIQAATQWLHAMMMLHGSMAKEQLLNLVELIATGLDHEEFKVAAAQVVNELARRFACDQVSLGFLIYNKIYVEAMSSTTGIRQQSNLTQAIRDAMMEAVDQCATLVFPADSGSMPLSTHFHSVLSKMLHGAAICTLPLTRNGQIIGALLLQRPADEPFEPDTVEQCQRIGLLLGPILEIRRSDERSLVSRVADSLQNCCVRLFGPGRMPLKVGVGLMTVLLAYMLITTAMFTVSSDSVLEAEVCQSIVAPIDGYIVSGNVRAGDRVQKGDVLAALDDRDLRAEQRKWQSQRSQIVREYRKALSELNRAELAILKARKAQAEANLRLVEQQLARTTLLAPFSGIVVKGDLSQSIGSPVERGDVLYEVATTDGYRVVMKVDDRDIGFISVGQHGVLRLTGIPDQTFPITVERLTPVSIFEKGRNYFRVEGRMERSSDLMRPGMEGIAKIEIGRKNLLFIYTRHLLEWLHLWIWKLMP